MLFQVLSVVGALMVLSAYALIQSGVWRELDAGYLALNIIGSLLLPFDFYKVPQPDEINFIGRPPAWGRPFGETGMLQLDVMTLVANGGRTSLTIGFATAIGSITEITNSFQFFRNIRHDSFSGIGWS